VRLARDDVVDPVLFHGHEHVLLLDVQEFVALQIAVEKEDGRVQPGVPDLDTEDAHGLRVVLVALHQLKADEEVEETGGLVLQVGVGQAGERLLEPGFLFAADAGGFDETWVRRVETPACLANGELRHLGVYTGHHVRWEHKTASVHELSGL
jgi:hypothetical protein